MSIEPNVNGQNPEPASSALKPTVVLVIAAVCGVATGYHTDWETAVSVFIAVISLFTHRYSR